MNLSRLNVILNEAKAEMLSDIDEEMMLGSPKKRLEKAGYRIVAGNMTAKAKRIIKKIVGEFGFQVLSKLGHTIEPIGAH